MSIFRRGTAADVEHARRELDALRYYRTVDGREDAEIDRLTANVEAAESRLNVFQRRRGERDSVRTSGTHALEINLSDDVEKLLSDGIQVQTFARDWLSDAYHELEHDDPRYERILNASEAIDGLVDALDSAAVEVELPEYSNLPLADEAPALVRDVDGTREPAVVHDAPTTEIGPNDLSIGAEAFGEQVDRLGSEATVVRRANAQENSRADDLLDDVAVRAGWTAGLLRDVQAARVDVGRESVVESATTAQRTTAPLAARSEELLAQASAIQEDARGWFAAMYNSVHVDEGTYERAASAAGMLDGTVADLAWTADAFHRAADPDGTTPRTAVRKPVVGEDADGYEAPINPGEHGRWESAAALAEQARTLDDAVASLNGNVSAFNRYSHEWLIEAIGTDTDRTELQHGARAVEHLSETATTSWITLDTFGRAHNALGDLAQIETVAQMDEIHAARNDASDVAAEREQSPFERAATNRASESVAAAENGFDNIRAAAANAQQRDDDVARWHTDDMQAQVERASDKAQSIGTDQEPPY